MLKESRIREIENYVLKHENVSIDTLCSLFNVSKNTIRRDITELEKMGTIKKIYGGITLNNKNKQPTIPFGQREITNKLSKQLIAKEASKLVEDRDIIFIDSGTTTIHMIPFLADRKNLTIVTNNVNAIVKSFPYANLNILSTGGSLFRQTNSLIGIEAVSFLKNYNISKCFMATTGVTIEKGVTNSSPFEYEVKRAVIEKSKEIIVLADNSKLGVVSLMTYCDLKDVDIFITDKTPKKDIVDYFHNNNVNLMVPEEDTSL